jgi:hypothetical protein
LYLSARLRPEQQIKNHPAMKRLRIPGLVDLYKVSDPTEIRALAEDPCVDRAFKLRTCPLNWFLLKRALSVLSVGGRRFPTMTSRDSAERKRDQQELWTSLNAKIGSIKEGPEELEPLANWIRGAGAEPDVGILAQQFLGRLFFPGFVATEQSWAAAKVFVAAPRLGNVATLLGWWMSGKIGRAKRLLAELSEGNLSAMNAIGIAVHNVVKGLRQMRKLYADAGQRASLTPEAAAQQCLFAPISLFRQATAAGQLDGCPFPRNALFVYEIGEASQREGGDPLVFMDGTWSGCPAAHWVPAMMEGLWRRAVRA